MLDRKNFHASLFSGSEESGQTAEACFVKVVLREVVVFLLILNSNEGISRMNFEATNFFASLPTTRSKETI